MSDLLQIADTIWCICDLVSHTELLPFMRYGVAICCVIWCATRNCVHKKIESDSCRTANQRYIKLPLRFAANRIWNRALNRWLHERALRGQKSIKRWYTRKGWWIALLPSNTLTASSSLGGRSQRWLALTCCQPAHDNPRKFSRGLPYSSD